MRRSGKLDMTHEDRQASRPATLWPVKLTALYVIVLLFLAAILAAYFPYAHAFNNFRNTGVNLLILSGVIVFIVLGVVSIALGATMRANTLLGQPSMKGYRSAGVTFILFRQKTPPFRAGDEWRGFLAVW
jgi:hypothetical protein